MTAISDNTPFIRAAVADWLNWNQQPMFTVKDICKGLKSSHKALESMNLTKPVSNELIRLENLYIIKGRKGFAEEIPEGTVRPPTMYKMLYCDDSLALLKVVQRDDVQRLQNYKGRSSGEGVGSQW